MSNVQFIFCLILAAFMIFAGVSHFLNPRPFVKIVPKYFPYPLELVYISGFFEVLGGAGLLIPQTRTAAAWGLIALFVAVFPANVNMAVNKVSLGKKPIAPWILWLRLPLQLVLILWAYLLIN
jgi:uncharacterized membrane protein